MCPKPSSESSERNSRCPKKRRFHAPRDGSSFWLSCLGARRRLLRRIFPSSVACVRSCWLRRPRRSASRPPSPGWIGGNIPSRVHNDATDRASRTDRPEGGTRATRSARRAEVCFPRRSHRHHWSKTGTLHLPTDPSHLGPQAVDIRAGIREAASQHSLIATNPAHVSRTAARKGKASEEQCGTNRPKEFQINARHQLMRTK